MSHADPSSVDTLRATAEEAARRGGSELRALFGAESLEVTSKARNDRVSKADLASEARILELLAERHPDHAVLAEESGQTGARGGEHEWVIDPLDGTSNFVHGVPFYCVSVACRDAEGVCAAAVLDPERDVLYSAARGRGATRDGEPMRVRERNALSEAFLATGFPFRAHAGLDRYLAIFREVFLESRGIRRCGAAALDLAWVAAGVFDGFFEFGLEPWDVAAGALLIAEAGGRVSDPSGGPGHVDTGDVVAGTPEVHAALLEIVRRHGAAPAGRERSA